MNKKFKKNNNSSKINGFIYNAGKIVEEKIVETIKKNYMPYAMSVIMSRAIPEIDGFKPSHRKLIYTMFKMGLLNNSRTKSANIVGQTMKLNPHGDSAIYETMVRMSRGYEALLYPYVDSKGNFGKFYSRDMACAASRYTEAKLVDICKEIFKDIDKNTVDFIDNYDNTLKEPSLLPCSFPAILVNSTTGIAVGMASSICSFNLKEVCDTTISLIKNKNHDIFKTLIAPDFSGGGELIYDKEKLKLIYETGRGGIKVRSNYTYDKKYNCIEITNIPPTTNSETIIEKIAELIKIGNLKEVSDVRDETGIDGLKITIDLKRGIDPENLMRKLFRLTSLEDTFSCNFNILVSGIPKVMGINEILQNWISFRQNCIKRKTVFELNKLKDKLHLLEGLKKILLDIDKAILIIKNTKEELNVIPNLISEFKIDKIQAEYVSDIKLRHLNNEYILKKIEEIKILKNEIEKLEYILKNDSEINNIMIEELKFVSKNYSKPRITKLIDPQEIIEEEINIPDYPVYFFMSKDGYFKKITPQSLKLNSEQNLKFNDEIIQKLSGNNKSDLLFFTNQAQVYKCKANNFKDSKASFIGDFIPAVINFDKNEKLTYMTSTTDYNGFMIFFFKSGRVAKVDMKSYFTKTNRKKLIKAYFENDKLILCSHLIEDTEYILKSSSGKLLIFNTIDVTLKQSKNTQGIIVMKQKKGHRIISAEKYLTGSLKNELNYKPKNLPSTGKFIIEESCEQLEIN